MHALNVNWSSLMMSRGVIASHRIIYYKILYGDERDTLDDVITSHRNK